MIKRKGFVLTRDYLKMSDTLLLKALEENIISLKLLSLKDTDVALDNLTGIYIALKCRLLEH